MDFNRSCRLLDIVSITTITKRELKKKYHKAALQNHPDKARGDGAKERFQEISDAYQFLVDNLPLSEHEEDDELQENENENTDENGKGKDSGNDDTQKYATWVKMFISSFLKTNGLHELIKDIVMNCGEHLSLKVFEGMEKDKSLEVYQFLIKYQDVFCLKQKTIEAVRNIVLEKYNNDHIYILNPNIDDLLENNIYKLVVNNKIYFVPLWHNEVYFDSDSDFNEEGCDIIVLCEPELPANIRIDDNNNIVVSHTVTFKEALFEPFNSIGIKIGKKILTIPTNTLIMKTNQHVVFPNQGLSQIFEKDIYNVSNRSDIIVELTIKF